MLEIPEAVNLSRQITSTLAGKEIRTVVSGHSPHKFAWYFGDSAAYQELAAGRQITGAAALGGMLQVEADGVLMLFAEGVSPRYHEPGSVQPKKHQFLVEFTDDSFLASTVQMYGGMGVFEPGTNDNEYYLHAMEKPAVLSDDFDQAHFAGILAADGAEKLSAKALLATDQRIPGLGNGSLQDILFNARVHPRTKLGALDDATRAALFRAVKDTVAEMAERGGRDTELDLFGKRGGYETKMSRNTVGKPCPVCGQTIEKAPYMGGSVYFCPGCQVQRSPAIQ